MKDPALALEIRARRAVAAGSPAKAWISLRRCLETFPPNAERHLLAAWLLEELGKPREALRHCRAALTLEGDLPPRPSAAKLKGASVLVAGAGGFVGRRLVERLLARGAVVHALLRPRSPGWRLLRPHPRLRLHTADLAQSTSLAPVIAAARASTAVYLAKNRERGGTAEDRRLALNFAAALKRGGKAVYLVRAALPVGAESDQALARKMAAISGAAVATLKLSRVYGPGQSPGALEPKGPGPADYLFVDEAAEAFVRALVRPEAAGRRLEIRSGTFLSGPQADKIIRAVRERRAVPALKTHPRDPQTPATLAQALLGWRPKLFLGAGSRRTLRGY